MKKGIISIPGAKQKTLEKMKEELQKGKIVFTNLSVEIFEIE